MERAVPGARLSQWNRSHPRRDVGHGGRGGGRDYLPINDLLGELHPGALSLGATVNFADILPDTLCIDPADIVHRISQRTKVIVVVHYAGHPCEMDSIMEIAREHGVKVLEDVSHAHGSQYKGSKVGTFGDIAAMSMMAGKSFAIGEGGMLITDDPTYYERCIAYGHYERTGSRAESGDISLEELTPFRGVPLGGYKHRLNQTCAAMGRVQLRRDVVG